MNAADSDKLATASTVDGGTPNPGDTGRYMLIVAHTARTEAITAAATVSTQLLRAGVIPVMHETVRALLTPLLGTLVTHVRTLAEHGQQELESAVVLGGDGTILRAAELLRGTTTPILGVNLGHVGFLAESEKRDLAQATDRMLRREFVVEERTTLDVAVSLSGETVYRTWALNEATVEKASRERMLEVVLEVDGRPVSSFGCDGVVMSTPTGSTAYSFSAGGPIVWPTVRALLMVPLSPHSLFSRPLVVPPESSLAVEIIERNEGIGVLWCDGRRTHDLPRGARVTVTASDIPVRLARLEPAAFTDRLVNKFQLPVHGWRGPIRNDS